MQDNTSHRTYGEAKTLFFVSTCRALLKCACNYISIVRRRCGIVVQLAVLFYSVTHYQIAFASQPIPEYQLKAAYIAKFLSFIEWPSAGLNDGGASLALCIVGRDPSDGALPALSNKKSSGHPITVTMLDRNLYIDKCNILFISASELDRIDGILNAVANKPLLTISDIDDFAKHGGMIGFVNQNNTIRFEVNLRSVRDSRLKISARLLEVAMKVYQP